MYSKKCIPKSAFQVGVNFKLFRNIQSSVGGGGGAPDFFKCTLEVAKGPARLFREVKYLQAYSRVPKCPDFHMNGHIRL